MGIQRLVIDQQMAEIGVKSAPAKMSISLPRMRMSIKTETPQMRIENKTPSFKVNRRKINNESGMKGPLELAKTFRDEGRQAALRGAANAKDDGNFIANPKIPGDKSIPMLSKNRAMSRLKTREFNIGLMPASSPEITWDKGSMRVDWSKHSVVIDVDGEYRPRVTVETKYPVDVFLRTRPYFRVRVEEAVSPNAPGKYVDGAV